MHHRGIATLLLEHLVSYARSHQITTFTAQTLSENQAMLNVFADAGLLMERHFEDGVFETTFPLPAAALTTSVDSYLNAVAEREGSAEAASLRHVLAPESVVVIGAGRRRGTAGRAILENIRAAGYAGRRYAVNPRARQIGGERCLASVLDLPEPVDLAVIAVPATAVLDTAEQCGQRGVRSLVVVTSGLQAAACADLLAVCRRHGMRLVGPDCFGVAVPSIGLPARISASASSCRRRTTRCTPSSPWSCQPAPPATWWPPSPKRTSASRWPPWCSTSQNPSGCCREARCRRKMGARCPPTDTRKPR
jgi:predicted CoA-binding protein